MTEQAVFLRVRTEQRAYGEEPEVSYRRLFDRAKKFAYGLNDEEIHMLLK